MVETGPVNHAITLLQRPPGRPDAGPIAWPTTLHRLGKLPNVIPDVEG